MAEKKVNNKSTNSGNKKRGRPPKSKNNKASNNKKNLNDNKNMDKKEIDEKVNEITSDIDEFLNEKNKPQIKQSSSKTTSNDDTIKWLQEQIEGLTKLNEEYENKYIDMKSKYDKLYEQMNSGQSNQKNVSNDEFLKLKKGILAIYNELVSNYTGNNNTGKKWEQVKIKYLLDKFKKNFNFV